MRLKSEGRNTFSNYSTVHFAIDFPDRKRTIKSLQLTLGGWSDFGDDNMKSLNHQHKSFIKQFFFKKSKDGYFTDRFLFIDGTHDALVRNKKGLMFHEVYLFLQEEYDKYFVVDYLKDLFQELDEYHRTHPRIKFSKYHHRKKNRVDQNSNHDSI